MSVCVYPVYMSCVHRRTVHQYKLCIVVQYICMWIYIYKPICPWVCPVYITFLVHRCGVRGRTWAFPVSGNLEFFNSRNMQTIDFGRWKSSSHYSSFFFILKLSHCYVHLISHTYCIADILPTLNLNWKQFIGITPMGYQEVTKGEWVKNQLFQQVYCGDQRVDRHLILFYMGTYWFLHEGKNIFVKFRTTKF
jgi:hypothetical protein